MKTPSIRIEVFRHDEKDTAEVDTLARLTPQGRKNALNAGKSKQPRMLQGYVVASPRERAQHAAFLQFFGPNFADLQLDEQDFQEGFEQIQSQLKDKHNLTLTEKFSTDERLNFNVESHPLFNEQFYAQYNKSEQNSTLDWQKNDSDQIILNLALKTSHNDVLAEGVRTIKGFKRMVGDMAEALIEYFPKATEWAQAYEADAKNYQDPQLDIFICSHSQNIECFIMKVIEMKEGTKTLEQFLDKLPHRKSFIGYSEGFSLTINQNASAQLNFKGYTWTLTQADLQKMIETRNEFNHQVDENLKASESP